MRADTTIQLDRDDETVMSASNPTVTLLLRDGNGPASRLEHCRSRHPQRRGRPNKQEVRSRSGPLNFEPEAVRSRQ